MTLTFRRCTRGRTPVRLLFRLVAVTFAGGLALASPAWAQNGDPPASERGTELEAMVGAGSTATHTGPIVGGMAAWRFTPRFGGEARGTWLMRGDGADAFAADIAAAVHLPTGRKVHPYVAAGFGLYHATFDSSSARMSDFYRRRLTNGFSAGAGQSFNDPMWRVSAGADWRLGRSLSVRPEVSALFVRRDGRGETLGLVGVRIGYRFVDRVATPSWR